ncbi:MAG: ATP-binding cassette domain-containing protein, partial [Candidatus Nanopelagicaceae bacterium]
MSGLLKLENVSVIRGGQNILGPINWSLNQGERWVVIGPNGAGNTTFLQLISALIHPSRG